MPDKTKTSKKSHHSKISRIEAPKHQLEEKVIQNLIALQKVHTNLAEKFEKLSEQISNLLALFEMSARSFASQPHIQESQKDKEFLEKIDRLLEQNKLLAKGLTLMEEKMRERLYGPGSRIVSRPQNRNSPEI